MANGTGVPNQCLAPFLPEAAYKSFAGSTAARWCKDVSISDTKTISCCLPCPTARWRYSEALEDSVNSASWSAIPILVLILFVLASHTFLPGQVTGQHFITTSATFGFIFFQLAWIIPLKSDPDLCQDDITAHDIHSDLRCAFSGASVLFGVWIVILSCFGGVIFLHLTVCWEKTLGRTFKYTCLAGIYGGSAVLLALVLSLSGVSYQFANTCAPNAYRSRATLWGPLAGFAGATFLIQFATVGYCAFMIVKPVYQEWKTYRNSDPRASTSSSYYSGRAMTMRSTPARLRQVLHLQWRVIAVVALVALHVILICVVFIQLADFKEAPMEDIMEWLSCLSLHESQKECVSLTSGMGPRQNFLLAALLLLMICPFWDFVVLVHRSVFVAWMDLFRGRNPADNPSLSHGIPLVGGKRKAKPSNNQQRKSQTPVSPVPSSLDEPKATVLTSQKIEGWQSPSHHERRYTPSKHSFSGPISPRSRGREESRQGHHSHSNSGFSGYSATAYSPSTTDQLSQRQ